MSHRPILSLRQRLIVLPALIVLAGLAGLALYEVRDTKARVRAETRSGVEMGRILVTNAIAHARQTSSADEGLAQLNRDLPPTVRHIRLSLEQDGEKRSLRPPGVADGPPSWFRSLVGVPPIVERHPVVLGGLHRGTVVLVSRPDDEIAEVWRGWKSEMQVIGVLFAAIIAVVVTAVTSALRPLTALTDGLKALEQGDFGVRLGPFQDAELSRVGDRFNHLVGSLKQATEQNRLLINRLMSVQDSERKVIAHELHDEFGPSLFAIRADLGAISRRARAAAPPLADIEERVRSISSLVEQIQRINSRMLERLRPLVLDQLGLREALQRLVEIWAARYPAMTWTTELSDVGEVDEQAAHALYRAVQECLTNIVRHANASRVHVALAVLDDLLTVIVEDDGVGIAPGVGYGFGLLGMAERARTVGGEMTVSKGRERGARITVSSMRFPGEAPA